MTIRFYIGKCVAFNEDIHYIDKSYIDKSNERKNIFLKLKIFFKERNWTIIKPNNKRFNKN